MTDKPKDPLHGYKFVARRKVKPISEEGLKILNCMMAHDPSLFWGSVSFDELLAANTQYDAESLLEVLHELQEQNYIQQAKYLLPMFNRWHIEIYTCLRYQTTGVFDWGYLNVAAFTPYGQREDGFLVRSSEDQLLTIRPPR